MSELRADVLVVGECNPHGADPRLALFHLPRGASGDRLRQIMGLDDLDYHRRLARVNLCSGSFALERARPMARYLVETSEMGVLVLCGARVREAFRGPDFYRVESRGRGYLAGDAGRDHEGSVVLCALPHPSGRNRLWNDPREVARARQCLEAAAPWVPWGSSRERVPVDEGWARCD